MRSTSCRATTSARARRRASTSSAPRTRSATGDVVRGRRRIEPVEEPHPLLSQRQRDRIGARPGDERLLRARPDGGFDECGEAFDGGRLEQQPRGDPGGEAFPEAGGRAGGDEGVAAEFEEVVVEAGSFGAEQLGEHLCHGLFRGGTGCAVFVRGQFRFGQGRPVELADRGQRDPVERHDHGRHHVGRQPVGDELGQGVGVDVRTRDGMDVRHQPGLPGGGLPSHRHREVGIGVRGQRGVDLPELDPESADLDLEVVAPHVDQPGLARSDEVTGPVQAGAADSGDEPLGGQRGASMVAAGEAGAFEIQLPPRLRPGPG